MQDEKAGVEQSSKVVREEASSELERVRRQLEAQHSGERQALLAELEAANERCRQALAKGQQEVCLAQQAAQEELQRRPQLGEHQQVSLTIKKWHPWSL